MLLRLRQACDHPLLVKGFDSNSLLRSSVEMANKLPREKQIYLLNCLEASLALCGICNVCGCFCFVADIFSLYSFSLKLTYLWY